MPGFRFSVPYNNDFSLLEKLVEIKELNGNRIEGIYLPFPQEYAGSGRVVSKIAKEDIIKLIKFCHENGIKTSLTINFTCQGMEEYKPEFVSKVIKLIKFFHKEHELDAVILANPLYIQKIKKEVPTIKVIASAFSDIDCVNRAVFFEKLGADVLTLNGLNRNLEVLKEIKELVNCELKLMVNEGCLYKCPFRSFHSNFTSHASREEKPPIDFCAESCVRLRKLYPFLIITSDWILPQWLGYYKDITKSFKIVGRTMPSNWIIKRTKNYLEERFEGNLLELVESAVPQFLQVYKAYVDVFHFDYEFFKKVTSCDKNCFKCKYCEELAKKVVRFA